MEKDNGKSPTTKIPPQSLSKNQIILYSRIYSNLTPKKYFECRDTRY